MTSNLLRPERAIRIEKSVDLLRSTTVLDKTIKLLQSDGDPVQKGKLLTTYLDYLKAAHFKDEFDVANMLTVSYLRGAVDYQRALVIQKSARSMQCSKCERNHPFTKSKVSCPCGNELQGDKEVN